MNKLLLLPLFVLFTVSIQSAEFDPYKLKPEYYQDTNQIQNKAEFQHEGEEYRIVNSKYTRGLKIKYNGSWKYHGIVYSMSSGRVTSQKTYYYGVKHGPYKSFHSNGKVQFDYSFKENKKHGSWVQYTAKGNKAEEVNYVDGLRQGEAISYHSLIGKPQFVKTYVDDKRHGTTYQYTDKGKLVAKSEYNMGKQVGKTEWFFK